MDAITNHEEQALARLPDDSRNEVEEALVRWWALRIQDLDNVAMELFTNRTIDTAVGAQLDGLGAIVGEQRGARDDDSYRLRIRVRILLNLSSGRADELLRILRMVTDRVLTLGEEPPGAISIAVSGGPAELVDDLFAVALEAKAAGVRLFLRHQDGADADRFTFQGGTGKGFGAVLPDTIAAAVPDGENVGNFNPTLYLDGFGAIQWDYEIEITVTAAYFSDPPDNTMYVVEFYARLGPHEFPLLYYFIQDINWSGDTWAVALQNYPGGVTYAGVSIYFEGNNADEIYADDSWTCQVTTAHEVRGGNFINVQAG